VTKAPVGPAANEAGWKDTVRANPGEITRILVPFGAQVAAGAFGQSFTGSYVWHCHILDHEDNEMMVRYTVT
jgi:FtsP/CotA-like multicopper oxidase with cupredoxin domain